MSGDKLPIGSSAYPFRDSGRTPPKTKCVITAHRLQAMTLHAAMKLNHPDVQLQYYGPQNNSIIDVGLGLLRDAVPFETRTVSDLPDCLLSKYTDSGPNPGWLHRHNENDETYASVSYGVGCEDYDVTTIRNRRPVGFVRPSTLLKDIWAAGYDYPIFLCTFSRGFLPPLEPIPSA
jgi:hypothetical protein